MREKEQLDALLPPEIVKLMDDKFQAALNRATSDILGNAQVELNIEFGRLVNSDLEARRDLLRKRQ